MDFEIILQECFLTDPLSKLLKPFCLHEQDGCQSKKKTKQKNKKRKTFKQLLLLNQLMDFEMISQECSLGDHQCHVVIVMTLYTDFMFVCLSTIIKSCRRNSFLCFTAFITCIHLSMASLPIFHCPLGMLHCLTC